jgi:S1-C subfamily serine protease
MKKICLPRWIIGQSRPSLKFALIFSFLVLAVIAGFRVTESWFTNRVEASRQAIEEADRAWLTARVNRVADQEQAAKRLLADRLDDLVDRQTASERRSGKPPFDVEGLLPSIVELFCLDNADQQVYYTASGTIIDDSGLILTNRHTLMSSDGSYIRYCGIGFTVDQRQPPKPEYVAVALAVHRTDDLAVLRITERIDGQAMTGDFDSLSLEGQSDAADALKLGDSIFIGGYPGVGAETFTFTEGVVSGRVGQGLIKTSALIDSGTSGGAAFDAEGRFVGVPVAAVRGEIGGSLGYLISAEVVDSFLVDFFAQAETVSLPDGSRD